LDIQEETLHLNYLGNYDLEYNSSSGIPISKSLKDPIDMNFNVSGYKTTIGARFKFLVFSALLTSHSRDIIPCLLEFL
jgi:hypothetical protein